MSKLKQWMAESKAQQYPYVMFLDEDIFYVNDSDIGRVIDPILRKYEDPRSRKPHSIPTAKSEREVELLIDYMISKHGDQGMKRVAFADGDGIYHNGLGFMYKFLLKTNNPVWATWGRHQQSLERFPLWGILGDNKVVMGESPIKSWEDFAEFIRSEPGIEVESIREATDKAGWKVEFFDRRLGEGTGVPLTVVKDLP